MIGRMLKISRVLATLVCSTSLWVGAQTPKYPEKTVTIVAPFATGGAVDMLARVLADQLGKMLGGQFIVENRPGAGTVVGATQVFRAKPDGHTLLLATNTTIVTNPILTKELSYQPEKFAPVAILSQGPMVLLTSAKTNLNSFSDFVQLAKSHPSKLSIASVGVGTTSHLAMEYLKQKSQLQIEHVPYNGVSQLLPSLINGDVHAFFDTTATGMNHAKNPAIKAVAVTSLQRARKYPDVPTIAEQGYPNFNLQIWYSLVAPPDTPSQILLTLQNALTQIAAKPEYIEKLGTMDMEVTPVGTDYYLKQVASDKQTITELVRNANLAPR